MPSNPPCKRAGLEIAEAAGGFVLHDAERGRVHYLNNTAALIYELCDGRTPVDEIALLLQDIFGPQSSLEEQVQLYVASLREEHLIT